MVRKTDFFKSLLHSLTELRDQYYISLPMSQSNRSTQSFSHQVVAKNCITRVLTWRYLSLPNEYTLPLWIHLCELSMKLMRLLKSKRILTP